MGTRAARSLGSRGRTDGLLSSGLLAADGYAEGKDAARKAMEFRAGALESMELSEFWTGKRVFVTGATGLVGSWLIRRLLDAGARVTALVRDWDQQSELIRTGLVHETSVVSGAIEHYATLERALVEY